MRNPYNNVPSFLDIPNFLNPNPSFVEQETKQHILEVKVEEENSGGFG